MVLAVIPGTRAGFCTGKYRVGRLGPKPGRTPAYGAGARFSSGAVLDGKLFIALIGGEIASNAGRSLAIGRHMKPSPWQQRTIVGRVREPTPALSGPLRAGTARAPGAFSTHPPSQPGCWKQNSEPGDLWRSLFPLKTAAREVPRLMPPNAAGPPGSRLSPQAKATLWEARAGVWPADLREKMTSDDMR